MISCVSLNITLMSQCVTYFLSSINHHNHHTTTLPTTTTTRRPMPTMRYYKTNCPRMPTNPNNRSRTESITCFMRNLVPHRHQRRGNQTTNDDQFGCRSSFLSGESHPRLILTPLTDIQTTIARDDNTGQWHGKDAGRRRTNMQ